MAAQGRTQEQLSRLSKAELIRRIEALRRKSQNTGKGAIEVALGGLTQRDGEVLLKHAVQMANLGYWIWDDRENRCIYCSEQLARMNGVTVEDYLSRFGEYGALLEQTIHPEDRARYDEVISKAAELKEPYTVEFRGLCEGGEIRYLREVGEPILDEQGALAHTVGILQDITEAKHIEEALRASEARARFIAEESPVMLWMDDAEGNPTFYNQASLAFMGRTLEQALAWDLAKDVHPDDRARIRALDYEDRLEPRAFQREYRLRRADGTYRWVLEVGTAYLGPGGKFEGYSGYCLDITESKRAAELLKEGEERFRAIADDLPVMIWVDDKECRPLFCNRSYLEFVGLSLEEALIRDWYETFHPDDRERVKAAYEEWSESRVPNRIEYRERRADGAWRWILEIGVPRFGADDSFEGVIGCSLDVTEQKIAEAALREREAWFRELFEESPVSLWVEDWSRLKTMLDELAGQGVGDLRAYFGEYPDQLRAAYDLLEVIDMSRETLRVFRAESKEALIESFSSEHASPGVLADFGEQLVTLYEGAACYAHETGETARDGSPIVTRTRTVIPPAHRKSWSRVLVAIEDITERKAAQSALREREAWFRELFEESPVSLWVEDWRRLKAMLDNLSGQGVTDLHGYFRENPDQLRAAYDAPEYIDVSRRALDVYRAQSKEELYAVSDSAHADQDELEGFAEQIASLFEGAGSFQYEARETACDGAAIHTRMRTVVQPGYRDTWARVLVAVEDITEQKAAETALQERDARLRDQQQELEQVSRLSAMGQLSGALSREIREPLTAMMNYTAAARRMLKAAGVPDGERIIELLDKAIGQARQAGAVTQHQRDLFEKADTEISFQNINEMVHEAVAMALIDPAWAGMHCDLVLGERLPEVRVNKVQIQQVIYNLIKNAFEAMAAAGRGELVIETGLTTQGAVRITVSDSGPGVSPDLEARLFEPFVTSKQDGLGLGLSISRGIVEGYRGRLWAEPDPGGGTRFHVTLPAGGPTVPD